MTNKLHQQMGAIRNQVLGYHQDLLATLNSFAEIFSIFKHLSYSLVSAGVRMSHNSGAFKRETCNKERVLCSKINFEHSECSIVIWK